MSGRFLETTSRARRIPMRWVWTITGLASTWALVGVWIFLDGSAGQAVKQAVAEANWTDPGWRLADVWANRAPVPGAENAAVQVRMVLDQLPHNWMAKTSENGTPATQRLFELSSRAYRLDPVRRLSEREGTQLHQDLEDLKPARSLALELARMPYGRYEIPSGFRYIEEPTVHSQNLRQVVRLLQLEAIDRIQRNDIDGALEACCAIVSAGRSIGDEPILISQLVRAEAESAGVHTVQRALAQGLASDAALARVQECLDRESQEPLLLIALRGDRATAYDTFERLAVGAIKLDDWPRQDREARLRTSKFITFPRIFIRDNEAVLLESMNRAVAIARQPSWEQALLWEQFESDWKSRRDTAGRVFRVVAEGLSSSYAAAGLNFLRVRTLLTVGRVMVAAERYRLVHGRWPDSVGTLIPRFLAEPAADPFTGQELILRQLPAGVAVYSTGPDQLDNGGLLKMQVQDQPGYDVGYRLWDRKARGQPPG